MTISYDLLTFDRVTKDFLYLREGRKKSPFAPITRNTKKAPGMHGAHLHSSEIEPLEIEQPIGFRADNEKKDMELRDELVEWLITDEPVELEFPDEPGRTYYAVVQDGMDDFEKISRLRHGTINFLCLDPFSYGEEEEIDLDDIDSEVFEIKGTAPADPVFELEATDDITFAMVAVGEENDEYQLIGEPVDVDERTVKKKEKLFEERGDSIEDSDDGWTSSGTKVDGEVSGELGTDSDGITVPDYGGEQSDNIIDYDELEEDYYIDPSDGEKESSDNDLYVTDYIEVEGGSRYYVDSLYGAGDAGLAFYDDEQEYIDGVDKTLRESEIETPSNAKYIRLTIHDNHKKDVVVKRIKGWHGPAMMKELDYGVDNFQVEMMARAETTDTSQTFRIEFYLFDEDMNVLGKMAILDNNDNVNRKKGEARYGEYGDTFERYLISSDNYNYDRKRWFGMLRMKREGDKLTAYVTQISTRNNHVRSLEKSTTLGDKYLGKLKYVQIHIGKYEDTDDAKAPRILNIKGYELNEEDEESTPYIAEDEDLITLDHKDDELLINGEDAMVLKDFGGTFFKLPPGDTEVALLPKDLKGKLRYRPKYR